MKTITLFSIMFLGSFLSFSQTTFVPDANFEAFLEANSMGDGIPNNQLVTTANIVNVTYLAVGSQSIADLTGIEDFSSLQTLHASNNQLTSVNFSSTQNLNFISIPGNQITVVNGLQFQTNVVYINLGFNPINSATLDLSQNVNLQTLAIDNATLTSLDVTQNVALTNLTVIVNNLTFLDLSNNPLLTSIEVTSNDPDLCIQVTDPVAAYAGTGIYQYWFKDPTAFYSLKCSSCPNNILINGNFDAASCGGNGAFNNNCVPNWIDLQHTPSIDNFPADPYAWMWSYGNFGEAIAANFNFVAGTQYTVSFRIRTDDMNTGCSIVANTATVNLVATNNAGVVTSTPNGDIIFNGLMGQFLYNWSNVTVTFTPSANFSQLWVFPYMLLDNGICQAEMSIDDICIIEGVLGVEENNISKIIVFPNPTKDFATISTDTEATYSLVNIQGQILQQGKLVRGDNALDVSQYPSGLYFINLKTDKSSTSLKLIKQ